MRHIATHMRRRVSALFPGASKLQPGSPAHPAHLLCLLGVNQTSSVVMGSANEMTEVLFA